MKIEKISYTPNGGNTTPISFGLNIETFQAQFSSVQRTHVNIFALEDNIGDPLHKHIPGVATAILKYDLPDMDVEDIEWTYSTGGLTSDIKFKKTEDGHLFYMSMSNIETIAREDVHRISPNGGFLWSIEKYTDGFERKSVYERRDITPLAYEFRKQAGSAILVPCQSEEYKGQYLYCQLVDKNMNRNNPDVRYFLAEPHKFLSNSKFMADLEDLQTDDKKKKFAEDWLKINNPSLRMDFGMWSYTDNNPKFACGSTRTLIGRGASAIEYISKAFDLPFIPVGIRHNAETPNIVKRVNDTSYGKKVTYLQDLDI